MVEIVFLGVGEAFDEALPNTSVLIRYHVQSSPLSLLLDCGFTATPQFWKEEPDPDALTGLWISHFHGDHYLGVPALLVRFWEEGRERPITILGQAGVEAAVLHALDVAYPGFQEKIRFPLHFVEVEPGRCVEILGLSFETAENDHSQRDLALKLNAGGISIYYSGDGRPTPESMQLAKGCDLIIHEAFSVDQEVPGHGNMKSSVEMAEESGASQLALVHIQRKERPGVIERLKVRKPGPGGLRVIVPEPGHRMKL